MLKRHSQFFKSLMLLNDLLFLTLAWWLALGGPPAAHRRRGAAFGKPQSEQQSPLSELVVELPTLRSRVSRVAAVSFSESA
jgi:hypothetical protein